MGTSNKYLKLYSGISSGWFQKKKNWLQFNNLGSVKANIFKNKDLTVNLGTKIELINEF